MSLNSSLEKITYELGLAIQALYEKGKVRLPGEMYIDDLKSYISSGDEASEFILLGALSVLSTLGLVTIEPKGLVMVTSRHAHFALGSLSKFLIVSAPAIDGPLSKHPTQSIVQFTKTLETLREHASGVDKTPLHSRRIVNLLIKSQERRGLRTDDVYLFVYRVDWDQYHLVGYSQYADDQDDVYVAEFAVREHLGLAPDQYELDPIRKPCDVSKTLVSKPNGVMTKYTFCLKVVKEIKVPIDLGDPKRFRWFTWDEIMRREGQQGEVIMESTSAVMASLGNLDSIPITKIPKESEPGDITPAIKQDDRIHRHEIALIGLIWLTACLLIITPLAIISRFSAPSSLLATLAHIAEILGYVLPLASIPKIVQVVRKLIKKWRLSNQDILE